MTVNTEKLVRMAEQIAANMNYSDDQSLVAAKIANHLNRFWDPRMKTALLNFAADNKDTLSPALREAIASLA